MLHRSERKLYKPAAIMWTKYRVREIEIERGVRGRERGRERER